MTSPASIEGIKIIDTDSHLLETADLWSSRLPRKWQDSGPRVQKDAHGEEFWVAGSSARKLHAFTTFAPAGWTEFPPSRPTSIELCDPASYDAKTRLERLDEFGIFAQVLYPNVLGFHGKALLEELGPELGLACTRAYNDYLAEWCSADPDRLIGIAAVPWWDPAECVQEIERCAEMGHRGILFSVDWTRIGLPRIADPHWAPVLASAQDTQMSLNLHVGFGMQQQEEVDAQVRELLRSGSRSNSSFVVDIARTGAVMHLSVSNHLAEIATCGICVDYPDLKSVIVESGVGYLPFMMEVLDWNWLNLGGSDAYPERELPSFYIKRQVYGMFWFEKHVQQAIELLPDNIMFETDFPHATSLSPGPASAAELPSEHAKKSLAGLHPDLVKKVLHDNAARLYRLNSAPDTLGPRAAVANGEDTGRQTSVSVGFVA
jgi:predicted TIM-barrel fold metal-dependent hydrolase